MRLVRADEYEGEYIYYTEADWTDLPQEVRMDIQRCFGGMVLELEGDIIDRTHGNIQLTEFHSNDGTLLDRWPRSEDNESSESESEWSKLKSHLRHSIHYLSATKQELATHPVFLALEKRRTIRECAFQMNRLASAVERCVNISISCLREPRSGWCHGCISSSTKCEWEAGT